MFRSRQLCVACVLVGTLSGSARDANAQRRGFGAFGCVDPPTSNVPYDGRFTFARLKYSGAPGNCYYRGEPSWAHGFGYTQNGPAESNLMKIAAQISSLRPHTNETNVIAIDDPELYRYP